jgi:V/A-type H+-transporting ATPase subunit C
MKLKNSDYSFLSAKSLILESQFPKIENLKSYLSLSIEIFIDFIKKSLNVDIESNNVDEILQYDWDSTINRFKRTSNIEKLIKYFEIEKEFEKEDIKKEFLFEFENERLNKEIEILNFSEYLVNYIKTKIDLFNILNFVKHKSFDLPFKFIKRGNMSLMIFKQFEKESLENFVEYVNSKYPKLFEKDIKDFIQIFDKKRDDILIDYLKRSRYIVFGPEILFSYLSLKHFNNINLRLVYNGIIYNLPHDKVIRRLRNING